MQRVNAYFLGKEFKIIVEFYVQNKWKGLEMFWLKNLKIELCQFFIDIAERRMTKEGINYNEYKFWSKVVDICLGRKG